MDIRRNIRKTLIALMTLAITGASLASCISVQAYQRIYLNDEDMQLGPMRAATFEMQFHTYREGAAGANGAAAGGGCGCN